MITILVIAVVTVVTAIIMMNRNNAAVRVTVIIISTSAKSSGDSLTEAAGDRKAVENYMDVMVDLNIAWTSWLN